MEEIETFWISFYYERKRVLKSYPKSRDFLHKVLKILPNSFDFVGFWVPTPFRYGDTYCDSWQEKSIETSDQLEIFPQNFSSIEDAVS